MRGALPAGARTLRMRRTRRLAALTPVLLALLAASAFGEGGSSVTSAREIVPGVAESGNTGHAHYFRACNGTGEGDYWKISLTATDVMTLRMGSTVGDLYAVDIFAPPTTAKTFTSETPTYFLTSKGKTVTNRYTAAKTGVYYLVFDNYCGPNGPFQFTAHVSGPGAPKPAPTTAPPAPTAGQNVAVGGFSGAVTIERPGATTFAPLRAGGLIALGSTVDATDGHVELVGASAAGATHAGTFYGGEFVVSQRAGGPVVLTLAGGQPCAASATVPHRAPNRANHLWGDAHSGFETVGHDAAATVLGTGWLTKDECTATLVRVTTGEVAVHDFVTGRNLTLRAPHHFLARG